MYLNIFYHISPFMITLEDKKEILSKSTICIMDLLFQSSVDKTTINNIKRKSTRTLYLLNKENYYTLSIFKYFFIIGNAFVHKALFSLTTNRQLQ